MAWRRKGRRKQHVHAGMARLNKDCGGDVAAHVEQVVHFRDAGRVPAQRLVELLRPLPSRKEGICDAG